MDDEDNYILLRAARTWYRLNDYSYTFKYGRHLGDEYAGSPVLDFGAGIEVSKHQALKTLLCLRYNIEVEEKDMIVEVKKDFQDLERTIEILKLIIINQLPEYEAAQWG